MFNGLTEENLAALHALAGARKDFEQPWGMLRRLCGIHEAVVPLGVNASLLRPMSQAKVAAIYQVAEEEVELSVSYLQAGWSKLFSEAQMPEIIEPSSAPKPAQSPIPPPEEAPANGSQTAQTTQPPTPPTQPSTRFSAEQAELLRLGAFSSAIFEYHTNEFDKYTEIEWFCEQIKDVRRVFDEPMAKNIAQQALLNVLQLRRLNNKLLTMDPSGEEFRKLCGVKDKLEEQYREQWEKVVEICPIAAAAATRKSAINQLSDIVKCYQEWKSDPKNRARDGVFTDDELQVLFRSSVQVPDPQYRFGWVVAVNEAKMGINDPKWKRRLSKAQCKILDASTQYAIKKMWEQEGLTRPDLESDGLNGEHEPLHMEADGEVTDAVFDENGEMAVVDTVQLT